MPTYLYSCPEKHGEFELLHSVKEEIKECPKCKEEGNPGKQIKRLINSENGFILNGSGWARDNYK